MSNPVPKSPLQQSPIQESPFKKSPIVGSGPIPGSGGLSKKGQFHSFNGKLLSRDHVHYVMGISGGDCAGKKQLINQLFTTDQKGSWLGDKNGKDDKERQRVTIINQDYFLCDKSNKFNSKGVNWQQFQKAILSLLAGNHYIIKNAKMKGYEINLQPSKLLVLEGNHIFMESLPIQKYLDIKVFVDSDSDVRVSRRIYKDTVDDGIQLNDSIKNYLQNIKPSYQKQIQPTKLTCDIIIPHFGGGYNDHRERQRGIKTSNASNVKGILTARIREEMEIYRRDFEETEEEEISK